MWPKRKISFVAADGGPEAGEMLGIEGIRALLNEIKIAFAQGEEPRGGDGAMWWEKPFADQMTGWESTPPTELIFWPQENEQERAFGAEITSEAGLSRQTVQSFIHNILESEMVLKVTDGTVCIDGCPLLGHILRVAGFEPSFLWPSAEGRWQCEKRLGRHWIVPESWWLGLGFALEDQAAPSNEERTKWVVRAQSIDFYRGQEGQKFVGQIRRWPNPRQEQEAVKTIARALDLGVSWLDVQLALKPVWPDFTVKSNSRWNIDDLGWNAGTCGEELPAEPFDYLENRRAG